MLGYIKRKIPYNLPLRKYWGKTKGLLAFIQNSHLLKGIEIIGITGTDGKTTTTCFAAQLLQLLGIKVAMMSSETYSINGKLIPNKSKRTTASPFDTYNFIKKAKEAGCKVLILEVSSHSLEQGRVYGIAFDYAIVTNLSHEHLDYHKTMKAYAESKAKLLSSTKNCVIIPKNLQMKDVFEKEIKCNVIETHVGKNLNNEKILNAFNLRYLNHGTQFDLCFKGQIIKDVFLPVMGDYNVENLMFAIALESLIERESIGLTLSEAIGKLEKVPGRLDDINFGQDFKIWISYGVTPKALEKTLKFAQEVKEESGKVWMIFGATGGQHDRQKRPIMGEIAGLLADISIITDDETYGEDSVSIIQEVEKGLIGTKGEYKIIQNRGHAISYALKNATAGDIVIITGLGNFDTRNIGGVEEKWNDTEIIKDIIKNKMSSYK